MRRDVLCVEVARLAEQGRCCAPLAEPEQANIHSIGLKYRVVFGLSCYIKFS